MPASFWYHCAFRLEAVFSGNPKQDFSQFAQSKCYRNEISNELFSKFNVRALRLFVFFLANVEFKSSAWLLEIFYVRVNKYFRAERGEQL